MGNAKYQIGILGAGAEGKALKKYFKGKAAVLDKKYNKNYLKNLEKFDTVFRSPGIPYLLPEIQQARRAGVKISSATKLFFAKCPCPIIGITGTKGKGTTATLLSQMLKVNSQKVFLVGNVGAPAISFLPKLTKNSLVVFELSSFQLQDLKQSPEVAVVLGISPDHLNSHKNFREYLAAKTSITNYQKPNNAVIFDADNRWSKKITQMSCGRKIGFALTDKNPLPQKIRAALKLPGEHNLKNAYAAALAAKQLGVSEKIILKTIANFRGLPFRLQLVHKNPDIFNDSASTNPEAAIAAIKAVNPTILIMGGVNKGLSYKDLPKTINYSPIRAIYLYGKSRWEISFALKKIKPQVKIFPDLKSVIKNIKAKKEDTILFSPGAASLDQFRKYQERGRVFNKLIKPLY